MAYYVFLTNFTDQGVKSVRETTKRAEAFREMADKGGAKVHTLLWIPGKHDVVAVIEAPDDLTATALSLSSSALGNVKTQTLKAFDTADMNKILAKMA